MKKYLKNQRGAMDLILLIILLILLLLLAIWTYYNAQKKKATPAPAQQAAQVPKKAAATPAKAVPDTTSWLNIDQFGVRGKNTAGVTLSYAIKTSDGIPSAYFTSSELLALEPACTTAFGPGGTISQYPVGADYHGDKIETVKTAIKVGSYYYIFDQPQAYCSVATVNQAKEATIQAAVKNVLATLEVKP